MLIVAQFRPLNSGRSNLVTQVRSRKFGHAGQGVCKHTPGFSCPTTSPPEDLQQEVYSDDVYLIYLYKSCLYK